MKKNISLFAFSFIVLISYSQILSISDVIITQDCDSTLTTLYNQTTPQTPSLFFQWTYYNANGTQFIYADTSQSPIDVVIETYSPIVTLSAYSDTFYTNLVEALDYTINTDTCGIQGFIHFTELSPFSSCDSALFILESALTNVDTPATYIWSVYENGNNAPTIYNTSIVTTYLANNTYVTFEVIDNNLDVFTSNMTVYTNGTSNITAFATHNIISSTCDSSTIQLFGSSNDSTVTYEWHIESGNNWDTAYVQNPIITLDNNNNYGVAQLIATNSGGCTGTYFYTFQFQGSTTTGIADVINNSNNTCVAGSCDFEIIITPTNGLSPFLYSINQGTLSPTSNFDNLCAGLYVITIEDASGCSTIMDVIVEDVDSLIVYESSYFSICDSLGQGQNNYISAYASNSTIVWSDGSTNSSITNPIAGNIYTYIITDNVSGCTASGSFTIPTTNCYTITGNVYADLDGDCIFNNNDYAISSAWVNLQNTSGNNLWIFDYTDANGNYSISAPAGTYYFDINGFLINNYTQTCPASGFNVTIGVSNPTATVDFFLSPPPPVQDLRVSMHSVTNFSPGFSYWASVGYCNDGTIPMSGTVVMNYDTDLTYIANSSFGAVNNAVTNTLTWTFTNLLPGQCQYVGPDFTVATTAVLGTTMSNTVIVNPITGDVTPSNNTAYVIDTVVGSWDPNDKTVYPQAGMLQTEKDHDYRIRFQNKGNYHATFVIVRDNLDDNLDLQTLRNVSASHSFVMTIENTDELVFTFNNIMLPAEQDDEPRSHGSIFYTISQKEDLPLGTTIENTAYIYFDFNEAVITNTTQNTIVEKTTGIGELANNVKVNVFPNPSNGVVNIVSESTIKTIKVFNIIGEKIFEVKELKNTKALLSIENTANGVYLIQIETEKGIVFKKVSISNKSK